MQPCKNVSQPAHTGLPRAIKLEARTTTSLEAITGKRSDKLRRLCCFALARLTAKGSVESIVSRCRSVLKTEGADIKSKVYRAITRGNRWIKIVDSTSAKVGYGISGLVTTLEPGWRWERGNKYDLEINLAELYDNESSLAQAKSQTDTVNKTLAEITGFLAFEPQIITSPTGKQSPPTNGHRSATHLDWKDSSLAVASEAISGQETARSEDAKLLLLLLSFLGHSPIPLGLLSSGASPRKRWNEIGDRSTALVPGLLPELVRICSNPRTLDVALSELESLSLVSRDAQTCAVSRDIRDATTSRLPLECHVGWRMQAFTFAYRSIPWKYLDRPCDTKLFLPHIRYTLDGLERHSATTGLPPAIKADVALSMVEASRLPGMGWKRYVIDQAEQITHNVPNTYVQSRLAEKRSLLCRISGDMDQAARALDRTGLDQFSDQNKSLVLHVAAGYIALQRALNHIQLEELALATDALRMWEPVQQHPSAMEATVIFRKNILLSKILRYQGLFTDSLTYLDLVRDLPGQYEDVTFDEDRGELAWNTADTLQELNMHVQGEQFIRTEMSQGRDFAPSLKIALAESLFAQSRFKESGELCAEARMLPRLLKLERLRLFIVQAKLAHRSGRYTEAFAHWTEAMTEVSRFTLTNGHTTRIILLSICDPPLVELMQQKQGVESLSRKQLRTMDKLRTPGGIKHWIPGLREWEEVHLCSKHRHSRI